MKPLEPITQCVVYGRVSSREQAEEGHGIEAQLAKCKAFADARGWKVLEYVTDPGVSGGEGRNRRPGLERALSLSSATPGTAVVSYSLSRLSRSMRLTSELLLDDKAEKQLQFASVTEPFDSTTSTGRMMLAIVAAFAQYEREVGGERTRMGIAHAKAMGSKLGHKLTSDVRPGLVKLLYDTYRRGGWTCSSLAKELNDRGMSSLRGGRWHATQVWRTLKQGPALHPDVVAETWAEPWNGLAPAAEFR